LSHEKICHLQKPNESVLLKTSEMLERIGKNVGLSFKDITVIKELIDKKPLSGHTPLTIIAGTIYLYCKEKNQKVSIKQIAKATQISVISIQRYIKLKRV